MYLKSIELQGFKSFAEKTVLEFMPPAKQSHSVTAVVGPNGSGKSNIADALRWVMGEQSMKQIRGKKSTDMIFAGSAAKGQMGAASVSITIDNSDKRADVEYDELVLTRKLYRSGESEYLVNGNKVRLLDVQLLLAKAQFGQGSYGIIGQGMIDRMLLQSAEERKAFFDEAAGIKEFQIKRHQAWLKLQRSKEHIEQAEMLLSEIAPRLKTLKRQVKKLEQRQEVETELRELQEAYYLTIWTHNETERTRLEKALADISSTFTNTNAKLTAIQHELAALAKESSRQDVFVALQDEYQKIQREKAALERELVMLEGRLQTEYSKAGKHDVSWLEKKITSIKKDQATQEADIREMVRDADAAEKHLQEKRREEESLRVECATIQAKIQRLQQARLEQKSKQSLLHITGMRAVQAVLGERHSLGTVYGAVAQLGEVDSKYQLALDVAAGGRLSSVVVADDTVAEHCIRFLRENQLGVATFLPLNKIRGRIIAQDIAELTTQRGVLGLAVELVRFEEKFADVFSYVLGNTLIVEDLDVARSIGIGRVRMVTLEGDVLETSGSMKGGFRSRRGRDGISFAHGSASFVAQSGKDVQTEIDELEAALASKERAFLKAQEAMQEAQSKAAVAKEKMVFLESKKGDVDKELSGLEQERSLLTMSKDEYSAAMTDIEKDKEGLAKKVHALDQSLAEAEKKIASFNDEEEKKRQRVFALQTDMQERQQSLNEVVNKKNAIQVDIAKVETKIEDLENEVYQELHVAISQIAERRTDVLETSGLEAAQETIQKLKYKLSLIGGIDEEVIAEFQETQERHDALETQVTDLRSAEKDLETLIVELDGVMKKRRKKAFDAIRKEFKRYFKELFDGGAADLTEVYGFEKEEKESDEEGMDDLEDEEQQKKKRRKKILQGIDIEACPPGKKIKQIQALSGGEKTMTSIALVCAILHTNPPPFVVLDEVEAALDEANTVRFTTILSELAKHSQFVIITHNRATMHAADALYGVTMGKDGISHLLSVNLSEAEKAVA